MRFLLVLTFLVLLTYTCDAIQIRHMNRGAHGDHRSELEAVTEAEAEALSAFEAELAMANNPNNNLLVSTPKLPIQTTSNVATIQKVVNSLKMINSGNTVNPVSTTQINGAMKNGSTNTVNTIGNTVKNVGTKVGDFSIKTMTNIGNGVKNVAGKINDGTIDVTKKLTNGAKNIGQKTSSTLGAAGNAGSNAFKSVSSIIQNKKLSQKNGNDGSNAGNPVPASATSQLSSIKKTTLLQMRMRAANSNQPKPQSIAKTPVQQAQAPVQQAQTPQVQRVNTPLIANPNSPIQTNTPQSQSTIVQTNTPQSQSTIVVQGTTTPPQNNQPPQGQVQPALIKQTPLVQQAQNTIQKNL